MHHLRFLLCLAALALLPISAQAEESLPVEPLAADPAPPSEENVLHAPEPNTMLLAGLGGLTLLFFAMRRK